MILIGIKHLLLHLVLVCTEIPNWAESMFNSLGAKLIWVIITAMISGFFGVYVNRRKFAGRWQLYINWSSEHSKRLLGSLQPEPHSVGDIAITYGHGPKKNDYWGIGYFQLFSGTERFAHLCIELADMEVKRKFFTPVFPYFFRLTLIKLLLRSKIRKKDENKSFDYGPWSNYRMEFYASTGKVLKARMVLVETNKVVGEVNAKRIG